jgi:glycosyltransferase involved in cell wall biosynthesis
MTGNPGTSIVLVGPVTADYRKELETISRLRDEGRWLHFAGELTREEVRMQISLADLVTLPSLPVYEAFPYAVLEGMALGKPVLATMVGAVPDMLGIGRDDAAGICVEPGDEGALFRAIHALRQNPQLMIAMGSNGIRRVREFFDAASIANQLKWIWLSISAGKAKINPVGASEIVDS